jgi:hypothetical protein
MPPPRRSRPPRPANVEDVEVELFVRQLAAHQKMRQGHQTLLRLFERRGRS